jgi:large subunit ribosomal protein L24
MIGSSKPREQRKFRYSAPMHARQHFMHAHIDKSLKTKLKIKKRAIQICKGDTVKIMTGANFGKSGKIIRVDMRKGFVYIDTIKRKTMKGKEYDVPISCSNVYITDLNLTDKIRASILKVSVQQAPKEKIEENTHKESTADVEESKKEVVLNGK